MYCTVLNGGYLHGMVDALVHIFCPVGIAFADEQYRVDAAVEVQLAGCSRLAGHGQDGTARSVGGHKLSWTTGRRSRNDGRRQAVDRSFDGGQGGGVGDVGRSRRQNAQLLEQLFVIDGRLRLAGYLMHCLHRLHSQHVKSVLPGKNNGNKSRN